VLGFLLFIAVGIETVYFKFLTQNARELAFGGAAAIIVGSLAKAERRRTLRAPNWLVGLGNASYSMYLVHYPLLAIEAKVWFLTPLRLLAAPIAFIVLVSTCICAGIIAHKVVEAPLMKILRRRKMVLSSA